ncbi:MAG: ribonuclease III [Pseudomonadota bacterium]
MDITKIERTLGYRFQDTGLLRKALTHRSHASENYERLEFLGDSVLGAVVSIHLYRQFHRHTEGDLTKMRARIVRGTTLAQIARRLSLSEFVLLGSGELKSGGQRRDSILADTLEAIIGAVFLDGGLESAEDCIDRWFHEELSAVSEYNAKDPKTTLQEHVQKSGGDLPVYEVLSQQGPAHDPVFRVVCSLVEINVSAEASGSSRKQAEQNAAAKVLGKINVD